MPRFVLRFRSTVILFLLTLLFSCQTEPEPAPSPSFNALVSEDVPGQVSFQNTSKGATSFHWDFGDGLTSTEENPVHIYKSSGIYQVTLMLPGENGVKFSRNSANNGIQTTQTVTVSNATSSVTAQMQGLGNFPFASTSAIATKDANTILIHGQNSNSSYLKITIPADAVAGGIYEVFVGQPSLSKASFEYYNPVAGVNAADVNSCYPAAGTVQVTAINNSKIVGTFTAKVLNLACDRYFNITNGTFNCRF